MSVKAACGNGFPLNIPSVIPESGGSGGTSDYSDLTNKPQINSVTLSGNKSLSAIGAAAAADVSDIQNLIPSDASTSNLLATAADIPGVATTSAAGLVQPDGTTITIVDGVISAVGGSGGNVTAAELENIDLTTGWSQSSSGVYYKSISNAIPAGKKLISAVIYFWEYLTGVNYDLQFTQGTSDPTSLIILAPSNSYASGSRVSVRVAYV